MEYKIVHDNKQQSTLFFLVKNNKLHFSQNTKIIQILMI